MKFRIQAIPFKGLFILFAPICCFAQVSISSTGRVDEIRTDFSFEQIDGEYNRSVFKSGWLSGIGDFLTIKHSGNNTEGNTYGMRVSDGYGFDFGKNDFNTSFFKIRTNGNIGIGTTTPQDKLQIGNSMAFHQGGHSIIYYYYSYEPSGVADLDAGKYAGELRFDGVNGKLRFGTSPTLTDAPQTHLTIDKNGYVGIGTTAPDAKLAVNGNIHAKEVKVDLTGWPDYVFKENYTLPTLEEVEKHLKEKGHLINLPSAKEVETNGVELGEMNKLLLEKIEELTLYTLQQQRQLLEQKEENKKLEERLGDLEKQISTITKNR